MKYGEKELHFVNISVTKRKKEQEESVFPGVFVQIMILFSQKHEILTKIMIFFKKFKTVISGKQGMKRSIEM